MIGGVEEGVGEHLGQLSPAQRLGSALVLQDGQATDATPEIPEDRGGRVIEVGLATEEKEVEARRMLAERDLAQDAEGRRSTLLEEAGEQDMPGGASFPRNRRVVRGGHAGTLPQAEARNRSRGRVVVQGPLARTAWPV
jgi:hypothetical protein